MCHTANRIWTVNQFLFAWATVICGKWLFQEFRRSSPSHQLRKLIFKEKWTNSCKSVGKMLQVCQIIWPPFVVWNNHFFRGLLWSVEQNKISRTQWFKSYQFLWRIMCVRRFERFWAKRSRNKSRTCLAINFREDSVCHTLSYIRIYCLHSNCFRQIQFRSVSYAC